MSAVRLTTLKDACRARGWPVTQLTEPGMFLFPTYNLLAGKFAFEVYRNADIHVARIGHARLVLDKYLQVGPTEVIHGGLTYNDYNIVDPLIDPFGMARGRKLVAGEDQLQISELRLPQGDAPVIDGAIWISGQTTPEPFFGHWLHENLSKIIALEKAGIDEGLLLVRDTVPTRFLDWIPLISSGRWTTRKVSADAAPVFENVVVPSAVNYRSRHGGALCLWAEGLHELRHRARAVSASQRKARERGARPRALFVRRDSPWRNLVNQDDIAKVFAKHFSVEEVRFEKLSPAEQVANVAGYDLIFGPSGSSMPVVMFADPGTVVCEFFNPTNEGKWAAKVYCDLFGLPHVRIDGVVIGENLGPTPSDANYTVVPEAVDAIAAQIANHVRHSVGSAEHHDFGGVTPKLISPFSLLPGYGMR